jgi:hypothetical protein
MRHFVELFNYQLNGIAKVRLALPSGRISPLIYIQMIIRSDSNGSSLFGVVLSGVVLTRLWRALSYSKSGGQDGAPSARNEAAKILDVQSS